MKTIKALTKNLEFLVNLLKELEDIEKDCLRLDKSGNLTEYGDGQLNVISMIRGSFKY